MDFLVKIRGLSTKFIQKFKSYSFLNAHKIQNACGISFKQPFTLVVVITVQCHIECILWYLHVASKLVHNSHYR